jgi:hypothetical protein
MPPAPPPPASPAAAPLLLLSIRRGVVGGQCGEGERGGGEICAGLERERRDKGGDRRSEFLAVRAPCFFSFLFRLLFLGRSLVGLGWFGSFSSRGCDGRREVPLFFPNIQISFPNFVFGLPGIAFFLRIFLTIFSLFYVKMHTLVKVLCRLYSTSD